MIPPVRMTTKWCFFTCDFITSLFSAFLKDLKYKAGRRRNVYIDTKHMESSLYSTYALFAFVSGISLVCCPRLFYFSNNYVSNLCIPYAQTSHEVFYIYYKFALLLHVPCNWRVFWGWYLKNNFIQNTVKNTWLQLFHNISDETNKSQTNSYDLMLLWYTVIMLKDLEMEVGIRIVSIVRDFWNSLRATFSWER